ncbi:MAG TPA: hypothetical protein PL126_05970 [Candidatus Cloacimonadota bacterium]|nr:hypothetical protein [Candidatus Cloacimonadota bacterium]
MNESVTTKTAPLAKNLDAAVISSKACSLHFGVITSQIYSSGYYVE